MESKQSLHTESSLPSSLLTAALAGLMGTGLAGCGTKEKEKIVEREPAAAAVTATTVDKNMTLAQFSSSCTERGGLVQTHASCGGSNSCAGVSYHSSSGKLSEHSCKGMNICAGMSCVELAKDQGRSGAAILAGTEDGSMGDSSAQCSFCHGDGSTAFELPIAPTADAAAATAAFQARSDAALVATIAFGIHGVSSNGTAYANMPAFYKVYSLPELQRTVTHLRSLPLQTRVWKEVP